MKIYRYIVLILVSFFLFAACDIEKLVDTPVGNWEVTRASLVIQLPDGTVIQGTTLKELKDGLAAALEPQLKKIPLVDVDDLIALGDGEDETEPLVPEGAVRMEFREDETLLVWTKDEEEHWQVSGSGEWSYAEGNMTLYIDSVIYNCTVGKLTNKRLIMNVALPDFSSLFSSFGDMELVETTRAGEEDPLSDLDLGAMSELLSILIGMQLSLDLQLAHL